MGCNDCDESGEFAHKHYRLSYFFNFAFFPRVAFGVQRKYQINTGRDAHPYGGMYTQFVFHIWVRELQL